MMRNSLQADMIVIGAGSGGLSVASGAVQLGLKVVLFEKGEMGGDCLNYGCVPSKALIATADAAHQARNATALGVSSASVEVDFCKVRAHVQAAIAAIAPNDSQERFERLGVHVIRDSAYFIDPRTVATDDVQVTARKIIIATGSRALAPPIPGLSETPYLTNETVFELETLPQKLVVLGGGPIGVELGQAFRRLGSDVVIIDSGRMLDREERAAAEVVLAQLVSEGVELFAGHKAVRIEAGPSIVIKGPNGERRIDGTHLLVAVGRAPAFERLDLERGKIRVHPTRRDNRRWPALHDQPSCLRSRGCGRARAVHPFGRCPYRAGRTAGRLWTASRRRCTGGSPRDLCGSRIGGDWPQRGGRSLDPRRRNSGRAYRVHGQRSGADGRGYTWLWQTHHHG